MLALLLGSSQDRRRSSVSGTTSRREIFRHVSHSLRPLFPLFRLTSDPLLPSSTSPELALTNSSIPTGPRRQAVHRLRGRSAPDCRLSNAACSCPYFFLSVSCPSPRRRVHAVAISFAVCPLFNLELKIDSPTCLPSLHSRCSRSTRSSQSTSIRLTINDPLARVPKLYHGVLSAESRQLTFRPQLTQNSALGPQPTQHSALKMHDGKGFQ